MLASIYLFWQWDYAYPTQQFIAQTKFYETKPFCADSETWELNAWLAWQMLEINIKRLHHIGTYLPVTKHKQNLGFCNLPMSYYSFCNNMRGSLVWWTWFLARTDAVRRPTALLSVGIIMITNVRFVLSNNVLLLWIFFSKLDITVKTINETRINHEKLPLRFMRSLNFQRCIKYFLWIYRLWIFKIVFIWLLTMYVPKQLRKLSRIESTYSICLNQLFS